MCLWKNGKKITNFSIFLKNYEILRFFRGYFIFIKDIVSKRYPIFTVVSVVLYKLISRSETFKRLVNQFYLIFRFSEDINISITFNSNIFSTFHRSNLCFSGIRSISILRVFHVKILRHFVIWNNAPLKTLIKRCFVIVTRL